MGIRKLILGALIVFFGFILACGGSSSSDDSTPAGASQEFKDGYFVVTSDELTSLEMTLSYKYEGTDKVTFKVTRVATADDKDNWVGLGFNSTAVMEGADFKAATAKDTISDMFTKVGNEAPVKDTVSNITSATATFETSKTTMEFTMPLANDAKGEDHLLEKGKAVSVLLAYGPVKTGAMDQHTERKTFSLTLSSDCTQDNNCTSEQTCTINKCVAKAVEPSPECTQDADCTAGQTCAESKCVATDTDGDGVPDSTDTDDDNDGVLDVNEVDAAAALDKDKKDTTFQKFETQLVGVQSSEYRFVGDTIELKVVFEDVQDGTTFNTSTWVGVGIAANSTDFVMATFLEDIDDSVVLDADITVTDYAYDCGSVLECINGDDDNNSTQDQRSLGDITEPKLERDDAKKTTTLTFRKPLNVTKAKDVLIERGEEVTFRMIYGPFDADQLAVGLDPFVGITEDGEQAVTLIK